MNLLSVLLFSCLMRDMCMIEINFDVNIFYILLLLPMSVDLSQLASLIFFLCYRCCCENLCDNNNFFSFILLSSFRNSSLLGLFSLADNVKHFLCVRARVCVCGNLILNRRFFKSN